MGTGYELPACTPESLAQKMKRNFYNKTIMKKPFGIKFDFPLAHSEQTISIKARDSLHHSDPYYVVDDFQFAGRKILKDQLSVLPVQEVKLEKKSGAWVHRDSGKESLLSQAIGNAIERASGNR